jgi:hypothetical protein
LRTLVEAGISARDEANLRARLRAAAFPVRKPIEEFKVAESPCRKLPSTTSPCFELGRPKPRSMLTVSCCGSWSSTQRATTSDSRPDVYDVLTHHSGGQRGNRTPTAKGG